MENSVEIVENQKPKGMKPPLLHIFHRVFHMWKTRRRVYLLYNRLYKSASRPARAKKVEKRPL